MTWTKVAGTVIPGSGSASGLRAYREIGGTIRAQLPLFRKRGLDLGAFHPGTINVDISPFRFELWRPLLTLLDVQWLETAPAENFSFSPCSLEVGSSKVPGLVYYPRPETKAAHGEMPPDTLLEILAPFLPGLKYGASVRLELDQMQIRLIRDGDSPALG